MAGRVKIIFLVYDSRSGSTLLAREIATRLDKVVVTPEIGFDLLLSTKEDILRGKGVRWSVEKLQEREFINLEVDKAKLIQAWEALHPFTVRAAIVTTLLLWMEAKGYSRSRDTCIVVKHGPHIRFWSRIQEIFGIDTHLLHIVRDPRAVISSKLRSARPYRPSETMAWGGAMLAAWRWRDYVSRVHAARNSGIDVLELRYEDFVSNPSRELSVVSQWLDLPVRLEPNPIVYSIPEKERLVHGLVESGQIEERRKEAWESELSYHHRAQVEAVCEHWMVRLGYGDLMRQSQFRKSMVILRGIPETLRKLFKHYLLS